MSVEAQQVAALMEGLEAKESRMVLEFVESLVQRRAVIGARQARRKVSTWLVSRVGHLLMGGEPRYIAGERPVWRVPVIATYGRRGEAASVDVDARSGDLLVSDRTPAEIVARVQTFVGNTTSN
jgi:hypothetical protein